MNLFKKGTDEQKSQADLLFEAQQRKQNQFRAQVGLSWILLLLFLLFLFSGIEIKSENGKTGLSIWSFHLTTQNGREVRDSHA